MKRLFLFALTFFVLTTAAKAVSPTSEREFELKSNFCVATAMFMANPEAISNSEVHQKEVLKKGVVYRPDKGIILYRIERNQVTLRREKLWFKTNMALSAKSLVVSNELDDESLELQDSYLLMQFHEHNGGTKVNLSLWVYADANPFFVRIIARTTLFRMEKAILKMVGELPPEEEE